MSASDRPISPTIFAEAIKELPLESLHAEAVKLTNDIAKLLESNAALEAEKAVETEDGIKFLDDVIVENEGVVKWKEERIELLKREVEDRGQTWIDPKKAGQEDRDEEHPSVVNGTRHGGDEAGAGGNVQQRQAPEGDEGVYL
ncbi:Uncharacterized protein PECH_008048 [Penicillium ucsense]|uniref:Uncharacterized protein n=1 Tax=Penicillium ucsense TaxID=2839758 RepID=A0A8J8WDJ5_9EURO|nr:Uncharacterized protein PECM_003400 [Penicillium ucsense]KAF7738683.1 Uncharacterized protein PECH_008048 [Penicillium ucsense]